METINGKGYTVETRDMSGLDNLVADLKRRGFDGVCYYLTGKRGAVKMAYKTASGQYVIVA